MLDNLVLLYCIYTCTYVAKDPYGKKKRKKLKKEKIHVKVVDVLV